MREFDGAIKDRDGDRRVATRTKKFEGADPKSKIHTYYEYVRYRTRVIRRMSTVGCGFLVRRASAGFTSPHGRGKWNHRKAERHHVISDRALAARRGHGVSACSIRRSGPSHISATAT